MSPRLSDLCLLILNPITTWRLAQTNSAINITLHLGNSVMPIKQTVDLSNKFHIHAYFKNRRPITVTIRTELIMSLHLRTKELAFSFYSLKLIDMSIPTLTYRPMLYTIASRK